MKETLDKYLNEDVYVSNSVINNQLNSVYKGLEGVKGLLNQRKFVDSVKKIDPVYLKDLKQIVARLDDVFADLEDLEMELNAFSD